MSKLNSMLKIGILVKKPESNFSNGCIQQALFLKQIFEEIGYATDLVTIDNTYTQFSGIGTPINVINEKSDLSSYKLFLFVSMTILNTNPIATNIRTHGVTCVDVVCGNLYILHQEQFVFDQHRIMHNTIDNICDEVWVLEMYPFMTDYLEILSGKPTHLLPYVWNTDIVDEYIQSNDLQISVDYGKVNRTKINILIFEPNMSIHKTSLVPLLIANRYHNTHPGQLNKVYMFCGSRIKGFNMDFLHHLEICKDQVLEIYDRMVMPSVLKIVQTNNDYMNIVLSHNIMNNLNFLHLELLHLGIPIVHNCEPFKSNGLYYDDFTLLRAVELLEKTRKEFMYNDIDKEIATKIITEFAPSNDCRKIAYEKHVERIMGVSLHEQVQNKEEITTTAATKIPSVDTTDANTLEDMQTLFEKLRVNISNEDEHLCQGRGIVISILDTCDIDRLELTLSSLQKTGNQLPVEIMFSAKITTVQEIKGISFFKKKRTMEIFDMDILELDDTASKVLNQFTAIRESNFNEAIYIRPGYVFHVPPTTIVDASPDGLPCRSLQGVLTYGTLKPNDKSLLTSMVKQITGHEVMMDERLGDSSIFYMNKSDNRVKLILKILTDIEFMAHELDMDGLFSTIRTCAFSEGRGEVAQLYSDLCFTHHRTFVVGRVVQKFEGHGYVYTDKNKNLLVSHITKSLSNTDKVKYVMVEADSITKFHATPQGTFGFEGKALGRSIPTNLHEHL